VYLPNGDLLTVKRFQQLGLSLGFSDGMATLNYLFENAFINKELSYTFLKNFMSHQTFDTNPIFTILHEACYAQNFSTNWSAMRVLDEFSEFNPDEGNQLLFTGEMLYPWMLDIYKNLKPFKGAANILANKDDWPILYNKNILKLNKVPVFAAVYENDMYVDRNYSLKTAGNIGNIKTVVVLCQKMIIRLLFMRSTVFRDRFIPLVSIAKFRVNVKNNAPKRMLFMPNYLSEMIFCAFSKHCDHSVNCSFQNCLGQHYLKVYKFPIKFQINFLRL